MDDFKRIVCYKGKFYTLTDSCVNSGAVFIAGDFWVFSAITRFVAPTTYNDAIDLANWARKATEVESAYCLAFKRNLIPLESGGLGCTEQR